MAGILAFVLKNWKWFAGAFVIFALYGSIKIRDHMIYVEGVEKGQAEYRQKYEQEKSAHAADIQIWTETNAKNERDNKALADKKDALIKKYAAQYMKLEKELLLKKAALNEEIAKNFAKTDVIVMPAAFRRLYDSSVSAFTSISGQAEGTNKEDRPEVSRKSETFNAIAFTTVAVGNVQQYNSLALKCNKLMDLVEEMQNDNDGTDGRGVKGKVGDAGGNAVDGSTSGNQ